MITRRLEVYLEPSMTMQRTEFNGNQVYQSYDNDPFFKISTEEKIIKAGWYEIDYSFELIEGEVVLPRIYFDFGDGFTEAHYWKLFYHPTEIFGLFKIPWNCYRLRLDLSEKNLKFKPGNLKLSKVARLNAAFKLFSLLDKIGESRSQFVKKLAGQKGYFGKKKLIKSLFDGSYLSFEYQRIPVHEQKMQASETSISDLLTYSSLRKENFVDYKKNIGQIQRLSGTALSAPVVDLILPVYNGVEYLQKLIPQIVAKSDLPFHLYIIDDCSPQGEVPAYLAEVAERHPNITVHTNAVNLGFTKTVNKLLKLCRNEFVVLLNSDIEVPEKWLSKLIRPMVIDKKIGTITPISNAATICSFPNMGDNLLLDGFDVDQMNQGLSGIPAYYEEIPTGVGFCMVIRNSMLQKIGLLNEEVFPRGYGEENDLCFRARKKGYKNVLNTDLFVYHKHGGSFASEEKLRLMSENQRKLEELHPDFSPVVQTYFQENTFIFRKLVYLLKLLKIEGQQICLFLDHDLGGGTNQYSRNYQSEHSETSFMYGQYINPNNNKDNQILFSVDYKNYHFKFAVREISILIDLLTMHNIILDEIIINNLVSYKEPFQLARILTDYKRSNPTQLTVLGHDFYFVCPNFLLFKDHEFCGIPEDLSVCAACLSGLDKNIDTKLIPEDLSTVDVWRRNWEELLLKQADKVIVFSESTKSLFLKVWPWLAARVKVVPHQLKGFRKHNQHVHRIGILGNIHSVAKGAKFVQDLAAYIESENVKNVKLINFGGIHPAYDHPLIEKHGSYSLDDIHFKLIVNKIDVLFIPSVCSETFSFTTREAIETGIPTACFAFGGQYDQVKNYEKGIAIKEVHPKALLTAIEDFFSLKTNETI